MDIISYKGIFMSVLLTGTKRFVTNPQAKASITQVAKKISNAPHLFTSGVSANSLQNQPHQMTTRMFSSIGLVGAKVSFISEFSIMSRDARSSMPSPKTYSEISEVSMTIGVHQAHELAGKTMEPKELISSKARPGIQQFDSNHSVVQDMKKIKISGDKAIGTLKESDTKEIAEKYCSSIQSNLKMYQGLDPQKQQEVLTRVSQTIAFFVEIHPNAKLEDIINKMNGINFNKEIKAEDTLANQLIVKKFMSKEDFENFFPKNSSGHREGKLYGFFTSAMNVTARDTNVSTRGKICVKFEIIEENDVSVHTSQVAELHDYFSKSLIDDDSISIGVGNSAIQHIAPPKGIKVRVIEVTEISKNESSVSEAETLYNPTRLNREVSELVFEHMANGIHAQGVNLSYGTPSKFYRFSN